MVLAAPGRALAMGLGPRVGILRLGQTCGCYSARMSTAAFSLERANEALADLRWGRIQGAAALLPDA
jgi:hypothetical protein